MPDSEFEITLKVVMKKATPNDIYDVFERIMSSLGHASITLYLKSLEIKSVEGLGGES